MAEAMCKFSPYGLQMTKQVIWANLENTSLAAAIELEDRNQFAGAAHSPASSISSGSMPASRRRSSISSGERRICTILST